MTFPLVGTIVNTGTVIVGSLFGLLLRHVGSSVSQASGPIAAGPAPSAQDSGTARTNDPHSIPILVMQGVGLFTVALGIRMALEMKQPLIVIVSLALGAVCGQLIGIEEALGRLAERLKRLASSNEGTFVTGFVSASALFCVGPMTILGSIQNGVQHDPSLLLIKAVLDGVSSVILASALGLGVLFSGLTVLVTQGILTLLAAQLQFLIQPLYLAQFTGVGGIIILAIGIRLLGIKDIKAGNFLPALVFVVLLVWLAAGLGWIS